MEKSEIVVIFHKKSEILWKKFTKNVKRLQKK
jgi:hypothetical protein